MNRVESTTVSDASEDLSKFIKWFQAVVTEERDSRDNGNRLSSLFKFPDSTRIHVFHVWHPLHKLDFRVCVISPAVNVPDLSVEVVGHYLPSEISNGLQLLVERPEWQRPATPLDLRFSMEEPSTVGDVLEFSLWNVNSSIQTYLNNTMATTGVYRCDYGMIKLAGEIWSIGFAGAIEDAFTPSEYVKSKRVLQTSASKPPEGASQPKTSPPVSGFAAFLIPPGWIDHVPTLTLKERLDRVNPIFVDRDARVEMRHRDSRVTVTTSGLFSVGTQDRRTAADAINELFAGLYVLGHEAESVSTIDLIHISDINRPLWGFGWEGGGNAAQTNRLEHAEPLLFEEPRVLASSILKTIQNDLVWLWDDQKALVVARFLLEANTHLAHHEIRPAFLSAWTALEITVSNFWHNYVSNQDGAQRVRSSVKDWQIGQIVDMLSLHRVLDREIADSIHQLRGRRNKAIHEGQGNSEAEARRACELAATLAKTIWPDGNWGVTDRL